MPTFDEHSNGSYGVMATPPSGTSGTSLVLESGQGARFPAAGPYNLTLWPKGLIALPSNMEIVRVTTRSTDTLTIVRAQESTTARSFAIGDQVALAATRKTLTDIEECLGWSVRGSTRSPHPSTLAEVIAALQRVGIVE